MTFEPTQRQSPDELERARSESLAQAPAPRVIAGYDLLARLGAGAFGEVWTARDQNTGVVVAVKFHASRGSVDWAHVYREVEKLVLLSEDRHFVKLLQVGWTSDPPYHVMEYVAGGSLAERLRGRGPYSRSEAASLFRELVQGMLRAHGRGVLHCDLKPENILLDPDGRPRIADFGQSRRTTESTPALGTLFYMAPEQADLKAAPDARWDVYALGAILHCLLRGEPPHRAPESLAAIAACPDLTSRLATYRRIVASAVPVAPELRRRGVDRGLATIVERCLEPDPARRFSTVQQILTALDERARLRARRPLWLLGAGGPLLLLIILGLFAWRGYQRAVRETVELAQRRATENNRFAAELAAERATREIADQFSTVEYEAAKQRLEDTLVPVLGLPIVEQLYDPAISAEQLAQIRAQLQLDPSRRALDEYLTYRLGLYKEDAEKGIGPRFASMLVIDPRGTMLGATFDPAPAAPAPIGENFAHRSYFRGGTDELHRTSNRLTDVRPITATHWSPVFQSSVTDERKVAISTPIWMTQEGKQVCLGVLVMTVRQQDLRLFREPTASRRDHFLVLVDDRPGDSRGMILVHPLLKELLSRETGVGVELLNHRLPTETLDRALKQESLNPYHDPLGDHPAGGDWSRQWLAAAAPVTMPATELGNPTSPDATIRESTSGLVVLVQEDLVSVTAPVRDLAWQLLREGLLALALVTIATPAWWLFVARFTAARDRR